MKVSICMTAYNRATQLSKTLDSLDKQTFRDFEVICVEDGDDGGKTRTVCNIFNATHVQRTNRPVVPYSNPAIPNNMALRRATGEITVLQNAECMFEKEDGLEKLVELVKEKAAVFAAVKVMDKDGIFRGQWYCHPTMRREAWFFCGAMLTKHFQYLRGFDEGYIYYGMDDVDFADRMRTHGIEFIWTDQVVVRHQWHETPNLQTGGKIQTNELIYKQKTQQMKAGTLGVVRNIEDWGQGIIHIPVGLAEL